MSAGWLVAAVVVGGVLVWLVVTVADFLPSRPAAPAVQSMAPASRVVPAPQVRVKAADILGYRDLGGRRVPPTHPATRGAQSSAEALAAWDARR